MAESSSTDVPPLLVVAAGKGGVGKSTVAVNLSLAFSALGMRIGLVDADLTGPNVPRMLNLTRRQRTEGIDVWTAKAHRRRIRPVERLGLQVMSSQFMMGESQSFAASSDFGALLLRRLIFDVVWDAADLLVVDLPPGTGDVVQQVLHTPNVAGVLVVVTPQDISHLDSRKLVALLQASSINVLGGVENMASLTCPCCDTAIELFPPTALDRSIWSLGVDKLASIPFSANVGAGDLSGRPVVHHEPESEVAALFSGVAAELRSRVGR